MKKHIKPAPFEYSNKTLTKPEGMTDSECGALPIFTDGTQCVSCWQIPFWTCVRILFTSKIWVGVISGDTQPPIWLSGNIEFNEAK